MKKMYLMTIIVCSFLNACAKYQPVVDTVGRSGTFDESRAERISDDIILCQKLAETNTTFLGNINHWILSPKAETQYEHIVKTCISNRGHSLLK
jgi:hypothetical protein|tara:strand:+ start:407 stop:688 length:282 start_codon:yes stop_codon:yes gene_type:complete